MAETPNIFYDCETGPKNEDEVVVEEGLQEKNNTVTKLETKAAKENGDIEHIDEKIAKEKTATEKYQGTDLKYSSTGPQVKPPILITAPIEDSEETVDQEFKKIPLDNFVPPPQNNLDIPEMITSKITENEKNKEAADEQSEANGPIPNGPIANSALNFFGTMRKGMLSFWQKHFEFIFSIFILFVVVGGMCLLIDFFTNPKKATTYRGGRLTPRTVGNATIDGQRDDIFFEED